jgi:hypothetical protein
MQIIRYYYPILTETGMTPEILANVPNIKFHENQISGSVAVSCIQTNGRTQGAILMGVQRGSEWP